jgi:hypothetical protein
MQASRQNTGPQRALIVSFCSPTAGENQYAIGASARSGLRHNQLAKNVAEIRNELFDRKQNKGSKQPQQFCGAWELENRGKAKCRDEVL